MKYVGKKMVSLVVVLLIASIICFLIIHFIPGSPAETLAGPGASLEDIEHIKKTMGLDKPLIEQYCNWIGNIVFHGDFGDSLISNEPVNDVE